MIIVSPCGARGPLAKGHASLLRHIGKRPVVVIVIEAVLAEVGHIDIWPPVIVIVTNCHAETPALVGHTCLGCDIRKCTVAVVMKQHGAWWRLLTRQSVNRRPSQQVDVKPAVTVVIK